MESEPTHSSHNGTGPEISWEAMWDVLSPAEKRDHILDHFEAEAWSDDEALNILALFVNEPLQWIRIAARGKRIGVNVFHLEKACRAIEERYTDWKKRQGAIQGAPPAAAPAPALAGEEGVRYLAAMWRLPLVAVIQHGTEQGSTWHLQLEDGTEIGLGVTEDLQSQSKVRARIFEVTHHLIPRIAAKEVAQWDELLGILGAVAQVVHTPELTRQGQIQMLVAGYCFTQNCDVTQDNSQEEWEELAQAGHPFMRKGRLHLYVPHFWSGYVRTVAPEWSQAQLLDMLRLIHAVRVTVMLNRFRTSRSLWTLDNPFNVFNGHLTGTEEEIGTNA